MQESLGPQREGEHFRADTVFGNYTETRQELPVIKPKNGKTAKSKPLRDPSPTVHFPEYSPIDLHLLAISNKNTLMYRQAITEKNTLYGL